MRGYDVGAEKVVIRSVRRLQGHEGRFAGPCSRIKPKSKQPGAQIAADLTSAPSICLDSEQRASDLGTHF